MGMNRNSVAQLILRARTALWRELRRSAVASIAPATPDCERALPLVCASHDGERMPAGQQDWLRSHLDSCARCRLAGEELADVGRSYRSWAPLPAAGLQAAVLGRISDAFGFGWPVASGTGGSGTGASTLSGGSPSAGKLGGALAAHKGVLATLVAAAALTGIGAAVVAGREDESGRAVAEPDSTAGPSPPRQARERPEREPKQAAERHRALQRKRAQARRRASRRAAARQPAAPDPVPQSSPVPTPAPAERAATSPTPPAPTPQIAPELEVDPE